MCRRRRLQIRWRSVHTGPWLLVNWWGHRPPKFGRVSHNAFAPPPSKKLAQYMWITVTVKPKTDY